MGGENSKEMGGGAWLAGPPAGQKGGKIDSIPGNPLGKGTEWSWQHRAATMFLKNSSLGVISKLQSAWAE